MKNLLLTIKQRHVRVQPIEAPKIEPKTLYTISSQLECQQAQGGPAQIDQSTACSDNFPAQIFARSESSSEPEDHLGGEWGGRGRVVVVSMADVHNISSGLPYIE